MEYVKLGRSRLKISRIALGTWQLGGSWGSVDEGDAIRLIGVSIESGINLFDTAHAYGFGRAEELLGRGLREHNVERGDVVVATKGGVRKGTTGNVRDSNPAVLRSGLEESLRALRMDYVDVYFLHWPDDDTPMAAVAETVQRFLDEGKIRHVGASNFSASGLQELATHLDVQVVQPPYSLLRRGIEGSLLPYCREKDIGVLVYGPLAHGILANRFEEGASFASDDWRSKSPIFRGETFAQNVAAAKDLSAYAAEMGQEPEHLAIAWTLHQQGVHGAIVGGRKPAQVASATAAADLHLDAEQLRRIEEIAAKGQPVGGPSPEGGVGS